MTKENTSFLSILKNLIKEGILFYRIRSWTKNLGIPFIGLLLAGGSIKISIIVLIHIASILAHTFSINDFYDAKLLNEDNYISKKIKGKKIKTKSQRIFLAFTFLPLSVLFITFLFLPPVCLILTLFFILFFDLYSCPPFRLKRHWLFSLSINALCLGAFLFLIGYFSSMKILTNKAIIFLLIFLNYIFSTEIIHQIAHKEKDEKANIKSFPNAFGIKKSLNLFQISQTVLVFLLPYFLFIDYKSNLIYLGTIVFSLLRIIRIRHIDFHKTDFENMRNKMYGLFEGLYYIIWLIKIK